jgi:carbon monoxide dehydrogenase subunit G
MISRRNTLRMAATGVFALLVCPLVSAASPSQDDIQVEVSRRDGAVIVHARFSVPVTAQQAFAVMTDYDHMRQFLPGLTESRILERGTNRLLVAQAGGVQLGPISMPFEYVRQIELQPPSKLVSHVVSGSVRKADVTTTLVEAEGRTLITYDSEATMKIWLPFGISTGLIAAHIRKQLDSMRVEMLRPRASGATATPN